MAYGSFSKTIVNFYNKVNYTLSGTTYSNLSIFKTNPSTMSVAPACYAKGNKQLMANMNANGVLASKVVAKCTASPMTYYQTGDAFYGMYYTVNSQLWADNYQITGGIPNYPNKANNYYPAFCIKKDGTAKIRWFQNSTSLAAAAPYCSAIIAGAHPLVYGSLSVFESTVYSTDDAYLRIADWGNIDSTAYHFNNAICSNTAKSNKSRVLFGHKPDGSYIMVCADSATMDLRVAAKLMCDLGCDYAINEDGAMATQMRVASGYSGTYTAGKMTTGGTDYYGACICAYLK